jgi:hypothetical protein
VKLWQEAARRCFGHARYRPPRPRRARLFPLAPRRAARFDATGSARSERARRRLLACVGRVRTRTRPSASPGREAEGCWLALGGSELERGPQLLQVEKRPRFHRRRPYCGLQAFLVDPALRIEVPTRFGLVAAHDLSSSAVRRSMKARTSATMTSAAVQARLNRRCRLAGASSVRPLSCECGPVVSWQRRVRSLRSGRRGASPAPRGFASPPCPERIAARLTND